MRFPFKMKLSIQICAMVVGIGIGAGNEAALEAIRKAGGKASKLGAGWEIEFQRSGKKVGDEVLAPVSALGTAVVSLNMRGTRVSDKGLRHISHLKNLTRLHLERTAIGDDGLAHLTGLRKLAYLNLYGTKVTDVGLTHLESLQELKSLFVWQSEVTERGCGKLSRALPGLKIVRGVDLDKVAAEAAARVKGEVEVVRVDLKWVPAGDDNPPRSKGGGKSSSIRIVNTRSEAVKLYWVEYGGGLKYYAEIAAGESLTRATFSQATWLITDLDETPLGYFIAPVEPSQVEIPKS